MAEIADIDQTLATAALQDDGFVVLQALLSDEQLTAVVRHADSLLRGVGWSDTDFDGRRTRRVYSLLSRLGALEPLPQPFPGGDGQDPQALRPAITGADAVIATVGSTSRKGPHPTASVARALTGTTAELGVRRLAIISAYPIVGTTPRVPMALLRLVFADAYADVSTMEHIVSDTDLDWTILRLNRLTDKPARGQPRTSTEPFDKPSALTRADAAQVLLDVIEDPITIKTAINVAGALPDARP